MHSVNKIVDLVAYIVIFSLKYYIPVENIYQSSHLSKQLGLPVLFGILVVALMPSRLSPVCRLE